MPPYQVLTPEQRAHFVEKGWLRIPNAIHQKYIDEWTKDVWARLGWDEHDKSTWEDEYIKFPRHREVDVREFMKPEAWKAVCDVVGGEDKIHEVRERFVGDQFIINFGTEYWKDHFIEPQTTPGWHHDNDWYRQFLDSSEHALTVVHCFTDIKPNGGGTILCEDGIKGVCRFIYQHPEGLEIPTPREAYEHIPNCKQFTEITANAGDTLVMHEYLPHTNAKNHLHNIRIITNPHITLKEPFNLNRPDGDYTLCEQVILNAVDHPNGIPDWKITRERKSYYPRTHTFKTARAKAELERMIAFAGGDPDKVESIWKYPEDSPQFVAFGKRLGYDLPICPAGEVHSLADYDRVLLETSIHTPSNAVSVS